jgi:hypothetical protein
MRNRTDYVIFLYDLAVWRISAIEENCDVRKNAKRVFEGGWL